MRHVILIAVFLASCSIPVSEPETKILDAGRCWFTIHQCYVMQVVGEQNEDGSFEIRPVTVCHDEWASRCREAELERYLRDGCNLVRLPDPTKIAVACGGRRV